MKNKETTWSQLHTLWMRQWTIWERNIASLDGNKVQDAIAGHDDPNHPFCVQSRALLKTLDVGLQFEIFQLVVRIKDDSRDFPDLAAAVEKLRDRGPIDGVRNVMIPSGGTYTTHEYDLVVFAPNLPVSHVEIRDYIKSQGWLPAPPLDSLRMLEMQQNLPWVASDSEGIRHSVCFVNTLNPEASIRVAFSSMCNSLVFRTIDLSRTDAGGCYVARRLVRKD